MNVTDGRVVAWLGFGFGSVISIAGNVLHAWLPADPPSIAAQIGAAAWSIALLLSVEAISRVRWRSGWLWGLARYVGLGVVGLGSFAISYGHMSEVLTAWGYGMGAYVGPIVIDGLMVISGFALLSESTVDEPAAERPRPEPEPEPKPKRAPEPTPEPRAAEPKVKATNTRTPSKREQGKQWAREHWPVTGAAIALAVGCSKAEGDRIRGMVKKEKVAAAS